MMCSSFCAVGCYRDRQCSSFDQRSTADRPRCRSGKAAQINTDIAKFKTRTGVDPLALDRVVLGMRYTYPSPNITKVQTVAVARGTFDAKAVAAAGRASSGVNIAKKNIATSRFRFLI